LACLPSPQFDHDGGTLIAEKSFANGTSQVHRSYPYGLGVIWDDDGTDVSFHHSDAHGSTRVLTDDTDR